MSEHIPEAAVEALARAEAEYDGHDWHKVPTYPTSLDSPGWSKDDYLRRARTVLPAVVAALVTEEAIRRVDRALEEDDIRADAIAEACVRAALGIQDEQGGTMPDSHGVLRGRRNEPSDDVPLTAAPSAVYEGKMYAVLVSRSDGKHLTADDYQWIRRCLGLPDDKGVIPDA